MQTKRPRPLVLTLLDGWGISEQVEGNAIALGQTPYMTLWRTSYPYTTVNASGLAVGLPEGQMGNSEVGHLNIGAGFIVYQDSVRISEEIRGGTFTTNQVLLGAMSHVKRNDSQLHLMGLIGPGGVHALSEHLYALLQMACAEGVKRVYVHAFLDGRDTPPQSALNFVGELEQVIQVTGIGEIATVSGRYYAMDRDKRWERVGKAYNALVHGQGQTAASPTQAIEQSYAEKITD
jgi:2,3-bisphosphoglycerate-independent phosphoglycerate mutase